MTPPITLAVVAMVFLAANSPLTRAAVLDGTDPFAVAMIRVAGGALVLMVLARGRVSMRTRARWGAVAALVVYLAGFSLAYRTLDAGLGALVLFATVQVALLAAGLWRGETMTGARALGMAVALGGLAWLLWPRSGEGTLGTFDAGLMVVAGLGWAAYSYAGRGETQPLAGNAGNFLGASAVLAASLPFWWGVSVTPAGAAYAVISGAVTSGLGYAILYAVLPRLTLTTAGVMQLSVPVIATAMGAVALGEVPEPRTVLAGAVTLGGIAISTVGAGGIAKAGRKP